ncbi:MAG: iron-containing alcohol dehydrogenase [Erysipelotrichaceae bacterium]|nr:iron-containing alcohol dehydrogenase [Erysipelotrichaceae bacterium]
MNTFNTLSIGGVVIHIGVGSYKKLIADMDICHKILFVTDQGIISHQLHKAILSCLDENHLSYVIYDKTLPNPPLCQVNEVLELIAKENCEAILAMGGGSVIDLAKAAGILYTNGGELSEYIHSALNPRKFTKTALPLYSIPTSSGTGSEVTQYAVITDENTREKITIGSPLLVSKETALDPFFTLSMPASVTANSGIDALAHALEAYTSDRIINAKGSTLISDTLCLEAIRLILNNLPKAYHNGNDREARLNMQVASTMAGLITQAGSGAAHGLSHILTSRFDIPHGAAIGALLKNVLEYNLPVCKDRYEKIARYCGFSNAEGLIDQITSLLKEINIKPLGAYINEEDIETITPIALTDKCTIINARKLNLENISEIYRKSL